MSREQSLAEWLASTSKRPRPDLDAMIAKAMLRFCDDYRMPVAL